MLTLTDEIDKGRFGRDVPLSDEATAALDAIIPQVGLIFGDHDYRDQLRKAAASVLSPHKAKTIHGLRPPARPVNAARRNREPDRRRLPR